MSSIVAKRLALIAALSLCFNAEAVEAHQAGPEAKVVADLYKNYAWQAMATQPDLFGEGLAGARKAELERYFSPEMARLLVADSACQVRTGGICNLDFDLLFDAQDPRVTDLAVERIAAGRVRVQFKDPATSKLTVIEFRLAEQRNQWRIADVIYAKHSPQSLKAVLSRRPDKQ
jgi:hypothetical protein